MKVIRTIQPSANGAKRFQREWGDKLVAVRYRNASESHVHTTIEIIVDTRLKPTNTTCYKRKHAYLRSQFVAVKIEFDEIELRGRIKRLGAKWSKELKCWLTTYSNVVSLGMTDRIIDGAAEKCTDVDMCISSHYDQM